MSQLSLSRLIKISPYWSRHVGVRWQLLAAVAALLLATTWLKSEYGQDDSNLWLVMNQFIKLLQWTLIGLVMISLLSVVAVWVYFLQGVKRKSFSIQVKFGDGQTAEAGLAPVTVMISGTVLRPLLGTIQAQLVFSEMRLAQPVILDGNVTKPRQLWRQAIVGTGETLLHDRGIYAVEKVLISFCDMLGLVSLPCTVPYTKQLYTLPLAQPVQHVKAQPNSTEEQTYRIDIPKRVEGEYVNYKEFEAGDNIQRIVWKIYAKSGQLVVRVPETKDPYASHVYFYASFFYGMGTAGGSFETELLNVYKDRVRNLFESLQRNGYEVRMPQDQPVPKLAGVGEKKNELYQITAASWQNETSPIAFVKSNQAACVCLSSLVPVDEVSAIFRNLPDAVPLIIVKLSDAIPSPFQISVKDIFFKPEKQPSDKLRQPWLLSSLRKSLIKNEKAIEGLLKSRNNTWLTSTIQFER